MISLLKQGKAIALDVRPFHQHQEMIRNSIWLGLPGILSGWASILPLADAYLVYQGDHFANHKLAEKILRQLQLNIIGTLTCSTADLKAEKVQLYQPDIAESVAEPGYRALDVRRPDEWAAGIVKGNTVKLQLSHLISSISDLPVSDKYITHCKMGYRSVVAYSLLKKAGLSAKVYTDSWEKIISSGV